MSHQINELTAKEDGQMEIKLTQESYNPLLKRKELKFEIDHAQTRGTPARLEIRRSLADILKTSPDVVFVKRVATKSGTMLAVGEANAYDSVEQAELIEAKYVVARNLPKEKKEAAEKAEKPEAPKPPEKAAQPAKKEG